MSANVCSIITVAWWQRLPAVLCLATLMTAPSSPFTALWNSRITHPAPAALPPRGRTATSGKSEGTIAMAAPPIAIAAAVVVAVALLTIKSFTRLTLSSTTTQVTKSDPYTITHFINITITIIITVRLMVGALGETSTIVTTTPTTLS